MVKAFEPYGEPIRDLTGLKKKKTKSKNKMKADDIFAIGSKAK